MHTPARTARRTADQFLFAAFGVALACCGGPDAARATPDDATAEAPMTPTPPVPPSDRSRSPDQRPAGGEVATFAGGCFWCVEAALELVPGVLDVRSGYIGGETPHPTYEQVCAGITGHAEAVEVTFDPAKITYEQLVEWFFKVHDPTTKDRQGNDVGTQYRSAIYTRSDAQKAAAERGLAKAQQSLRAPIVTEIAPAGRFWPAEEYHQDYFRKNPGNSYCQAVIPPKLKKLGLDAK